MAGDVTTVEIEALLVVVWAVGLVVRLAAVVVRKVTRRGVTGMGFARGQMGSGVGRFVCRGPVLGWPRLCRTCWFRFGCQRGHLVAWQDGGADVSGNMVPQCGPCNQKQGSRTPWWAWVRWVVPWLPWWFPVPTPLLVVVVVFWVSTK